MNRSLPLALVASLLLLSACGTLPEAPPTAPSAALPPQPQASGQLELTLASGDYSCEQGIHLQVQRDIRDQVTHGIRIGWNGHSYQLARDPSKSGLPRFEDALSGLVWIDLPWKGVLLDGRSNRPLANECRSI